MKVPNTILTKMEEFCVGAVNEIYERYIIISRAQESGDSFDTYLSSVRTVAKTCNYGALNDDLIRDRIVIGIKSDSIRKTCFTEASSILTSMYKCAERMNQQIKIYEL